MILGGILAISLKGGQGGLRWPPRWTGHGDRRQPRSDCHY
jgi:hypothetical protein